MDINSRIFDYLKHNRSIQLIGLPGSGREDLLKEIVTSRELRQSYLAGVTDQYHFVLVSFALLRDVNYQNIINLIRLSVHESLGKRTSLNKKLTESSFDKDLILTQDFRNTIKDLSENNIRVVLLFDRFEDVAQSIDRDFFILLDHLNKHYQLTSIFSLTRAIEQLFDPEILDVAGSILSGNEVYVDFDRNPIEVIDRIVNDSKTRIDENVKNEIVRVTGGFRKMIIIGTEDYLREENVSDINKFFLEDRSVRAVSYNIWGILNGCERTLLKLSVESKLEIEDKKEHNKAYDYLNSIQLIRDDKITIPLFEDFVRYRVEHKLDEKYTIGENDRIFLSEKDITNRFTKLEYRALIILLKNMNQIVNRDEFIDYVWSENKSVEGITDQAVDQLLFRIRKKVEEDHSNPKHIVSIKGRGIIFSSS